MKTTMNSFSGFSRKTLTFLSQNHRKNSKSWFEAHRDDYQNFVLTPFRALSDSLAMIVGQIDEEIETRSQRTVSRIYRDTRFSKDKSLYKKALWITFKRSIDDWPDFPAFFFELSPTSYCFGMGFYAASRDTMDKIRTLLEKKPKIILTQLSALKKLHGFELEGDEYKRIINPAIPGGIMSLYQKKNIYLIKNSTINENVFSESLLSEIGNGFGALGSLYHLFADLHSKDIDKIIIADS